MGSLSQWALHSKVHWHRSITTALAISGIPSLIILGVLISGAPWTSLIMPWMVVMSGGVVALCCGYVIYWWDGRKEVRTIQKLLSCPLFANWQFNSHEWEAILQKRMAEMKWSLKDFKSGLGCALPIGLVFGGGILLWAIFGKGPGRVYLALLGVGIFLLFPSVATFQGFWSHVKAWALWHQRLRLPRPKLFIGTTGLYHEVDGYMSFEDLKEVSLNKTSPWVLKLKFTENIDGKKYKVTQKVELPLIPADTCKTFVKQFRDSLKKKQP